MKKGTWFAFAITLSLFQLLAPFSAVIAQTVDTDPVHILQMQTLIKAVQNGQDTDPVHIAQANAYLTANSTAAPVQAATSVLQQTQTAVLSTLINDPDPAHVQQMQSLIKAVQSGQDTDPVHIAQANTYLGVQVSAPKTTVSGGTQPTPTTPPTQTQTPPVTTNSSNNSLAGINLYVNTNSSAANQAAQWRNSRPGDAQKMDSLAAAATAQWIGEWSGDPSSAVSQVVTQATRQNQTAVLVAYDIPQRDCGGYSSGGSNDYVNWVKSFARGIGNNSVVVLLEPDSLALIDCLSVQQLSDRYSMLSQAVSILKNNPNTRVYLDAGHSQWVEPTTMAARLQEAGIAQADGFFTNVSNFMPTNDEVAYGTQLSQKLGGKHFVIDTSRNGSGSIGGQWCNPWGASIGQKPSTNTGNSLVDAYLWAKTPGESDGSCNGGPSAGVWWPDYALSLVR